MFHQLKRRVDWSRIRDGGVPRDAAASRYGARILMRALSILDRFAEREEWGFTDLCEAVGLPKSTAFRIVSTLEAAAYLEKRPVTGHYGTGSKLRRLENVLLRVEPLRWAALPPLQDLARQTEETAHIGVLYQGDSVTVQIVEGSHSVRMHSAVGKRAPAHCSALGKTFLAYFTDVELDEFVDRFGLRMLTARTITGPGRLRTHLRDVRRRGWAVDNEELEDGLRCVAVQIAHVLQQTARKIAGMLDRDRPSGGPA